MQAQYRDPPPYPGHSKQLAQPGPRKKSFSGSENSTDISLSSTENLSICTSLRQEPQGEENQSTNLYHPPDPVAVDSEYSILARLGMPTSAMEANTSNSPAYYVGSSGVEGMHANRYPAPPEVHVSQDYLNNESVQWQNNQLAGSPQRPVNVTKTMEFYRNPISMYQTSSLVEQPLTSGHNVNLDQLQINNQLLYLTNLPPPPEYPGPTLITTSPEKKDLRRSYEMLDKKDITRSQPDLSRLLDSQSKPVNLIYASKSQKSADQGSISSEVFSQQVEYVPSMNASQVIEYLTEQNKQLQEQIRIRDKKVTKLQNFELEIQKVHDSYQDLVRSSLKRERLEDVRRKQFEVELRRYSEQIKVLKEQLERATIARKEPYSSFLVDNETRTEIAKKDAMITKLVSKNKELENAKEHLLLEVGAMRAKIQQQASHVDVLDSALTSAQANVVHLEDECEKKQIYMNRVYQLQDAFASLQAACEKREHMERQRQAKLERELELLRSQQQSPRKAGEPNVREGSRAVENAATLKRQVSDRDAKILQLETEIVKLEQKCIEESAMTKMRQMAIDEAEAPKGSRLAEIEQNSADTEKLISEAKTEKLRHMEDLYQSNRKVAELESRVKSLQTQLAEKDAMVKVLQRSSMPRSSSLHTVYCTPLHSPRPSLISTGSLGRHCSPSDAYRDYGGTIKHGKSGSTSAIETKRTSIDEEMKEKIHGAQSEDSDQEKPEDDKLWHV